VHSPPHSLPDMQAGDRRCEREGRPGIGSAPPAASSAGMHRAGDAGGSGRFVQAMSGYAPADSQGNFQLPTDSDTTDLFDELEYDPSERRPGGRVAAAVRAAGPQARRQKWILPLVGFLASLLIQSIGLCASTQRYVLWMAQLDHQLVSHDGAVPAGAAGNRSLPIEMLGPRDNFADWLGHGSASKLPVDVVAWAIPCVWVATALTSGNLRLWAHTLLAASLLALMKGTFAWMTLVPDASGWEACRERLHPQGQQPAPVPSVLMVLGLWFQDLVFGMRRQQTLVCTSSFSGPSYICALFSLGLYDACRIKVRQLKPQFRTLSHVLSAVVLTAIVLTDAYLDLVTGRQYTMDVALALAFALLFYSSPVIAMSVDSFLIWGCPIDADAKGGCDVGDVVVPPCCMPFCFMHGRYFLHTKPADQVQAAMRAQAEARRVAEEFRLEQEEATRRVMELETQLKAVRQRSELRERQDDADMQRRLGDQLAEARRVQETRLAKELARLEASANAEQQRGAELEARAAQATARLRETQLQHEKEKPQLEAELEAARQAAEAAHAALIRSQEEAEEGSRSVEEMRQRVVELEAAHGDSGFPGLAEFSARTAAALALVVSEVPKAAVSLSSGDFRIMPLSSWAVCYARFACGQPSSPGERQHDTAPSRTAAPVDSPMMSLGDFRSVTPTFWTHCHASFRRSLSAEQTPFVDVKAAGLRSSKPALLASDFRSLPSNMWSTCHAPFAPRAGQGDSIRAIVPREILIHPEASVMARGGDIRGLPPTFWSSLHARFGRKAALGPAGEGGGAAAGDPTGVAAAAAAAPACVLVPPGAAQFARCPPAYWLELYSRFTPGGRAGADA